MRHWEISGNLDNPQDGLTNYLQFQQTICQVKHLFDNIFGTDTLDKIDLLVDNATGGSGYAPITTPVLGKYVIIKLNITSSDSNSKIAFQFSHELTHFVFHSYWGLNRPRANDQEETICTAASLITLKLLYPEAFDSYVKYVRKLSNTAYREGAELAASIDYDFTKLKAIICRLRSGAKGVYAGLY